MTDVRARLNHNIFLYFENVFAVVAAAAAACCYYCGNESARPKTERRRMTKKRCRDGL